MRRSQPHPDLPYHHGRPLSPALKSKAESSFGRDLSSVRVHAGEEPGRVVDAFGADAFALGSDIWLSSRVDARNERVMAHELAHVVSGGPDLYLRRATWIERRAWLASFSHYLPRMFLNNYMDDTGTPITLTRQMMIDCNPIVDLHRSTGFMAQVATLRAAGGGTAPVAVSGWGGALTNGTLGNFTIHYNGTVTVSATGSWSFTGNMDFYDYWDFDPKPFGSGSGRPIPAEIKVRVAAAGLPGRPFDIRSVTVPVTQADTASSASWSGVSPAPTGDHGARTGADIEVGGAEGAVGGPDTEVGGGEVGAQGSEDLNH